MTDGQILEQCKMCTAAVRIAAEFGCDLIGIQYQQGLKDIAPASDRVEALLTNVERPPVSANGAGANFIRTGVEPPSSELGGQP